MANFIIITITTLFLLLSSSLATATTTTKDVPFIVAHKKATLTRLKSGTDRVSVSIDIYNQGSSTAYDVTLNDDNWPRDTFTVVTGNTSQSWERLDAGGILSHSIELETNTKGVFYGVPAIITFRIPTKAALQVAYSTPILPLDILTDKPAEQKLDLAKRLLAKYGSQISVISIVSLFVYLLMTPTKPNSAKGGKKKR
ncbi:hypothetical protein ACFE04_005157 [Oxalis oulophora]